MLASSGTVCPSEVAPGPLDADSAALRAAASASSAARFSALGSTKTSPELPSIAISVPSPSSPAPGSATIAGTPSARARMALWLVGPPSSVTKPSTSVGSSSAVSAGARSRAIRMYGSSLSGTPGIGTPSSRATIRFRTSSRSATRPARYSPAPASSARYEAKAS